jgi:hypothetical protein
MKEDFLHYVWQYQYFDQAELQTAEGERVLVIRPGHRNADAGPDFLGAQLLLNDVKWVGSVEIHLRASDWLRHHHHHDPKYDQVILHVVWENDCPVTRTDGTPIPTLPLQDRVAPDLLSSYQNLLQSPATLPCAPFIRQVPDLTRKSMQDRALLERLEEKADLVLQQYRGTGQDWEATAYQVIAAAFGFKINQEPFLRLSRALPLPVLKRHRHAVFQLEALLLGQAGLLPGEQEGDEYTQRLKKEYAYLAHKYGLAPEAMRPSDWNFLRLRPSNFPTVRLAQLAALLSAREHLFASLRHEGRLADYENFFRVTLSDYWRTHYRPGRESSGGAMAMGTASIHTLMVNTVVPLLVAYSRQTGEQAWQDKALDLLEQLPAEHNRITRVYEALRLENKTAADSQGYLALNRHYCLPRRCLACAVGNQILKHKLPVA